VFENRALKRIWEPKRDEVTGGWRRLHNEEAHNFFPSPDFIRVIKSVGGRCNAHGADEKCL
jgi:hypothetical protein